MSTVETKLFVIEDPNLRAALFRIETIRQILAIDDVPVSEEDKNQRCQEVWEAFLQKDPKATVKLPRNWRDFYHILYGTKDPVPEERNGRPGRRYDDETTYP